MSDWDRDTIEKLAVGINQYIEEQGCDYMGDPWYVSYGGPFGFYLECGFSGDWKHGHLRFKYLTEEYLKGIGLMPLVITVYEQEDNGTDYYYAEHRCIIPCTSHNKKPVCETNSTYVVRANGEVRGIFVHRENAIEYAKLLKKQGSKPTITEG